VHGYPAAERVAYELEGLGSCPGEVGGGGQRDEELGGVEAGVMGEVGRVVREAAAKEVEEQDAAASFFDQGIGELG
jgi:hypothetical protein